MRLAGEERNNCGSIEKYETTKLVEKILIWGIL
jgi:hypothetical protein